MLQVRRFTGETRRTIARTLAAASCATGSPAAIIGIWRRGRASERRNLNQPPLAPICV